MTVDYQYVVLRLVPRVEREEFINVGVVLYSQEAEFLRGAFALDDARALALDPDLDLEAVRSALETVCRVAGGEHSPSTPRLDRLGPRFGWLSAPRSTIVQPGPIHGGTTGNPAATLEHLVQVLVRR
ncbi:DUF3037 domain-containing protein [Ornithinimicrobium pekingense]|uniref:DUF3037 domain-containing protein n=1 Tax=Ornithinimicrobium pekingense TaxID=384677 RepID=A0ABQ2FBR7_9MICO|nr:DUF3037 domain-containing protein [Ornithinimicrobium pekingense]GGK81399.1 hypothetical protein GCM10011509_32360 [Ornithinimicrobium pekingense]